MSQNKRKLFSSLIALVLISACSTQPPSSHHASETVLITSLSPQPNQAVSLDDSTQVIKRIRINHYKVECEGYWVDQCLQYQEEGDTDWRYLYEKIEGFDFEWGHEYELLVEVDRTPAMEGLADQLTTAYRLIHLLKDTHYVDESFVYSIKYSSTLLTKQTDGTFSLLDGTSINCGIDDCQSIESAITQQQGITLSLKHDANPAQPLVVEAVLCSSSLASFGSDCGAYGL